MIVRRAKRYELSKINDLMNKYALPTIDDSYINHRDVALVALDQTKVVGFLWLGLMRQNRSCYFDKFLVDADYSHQGVGREIGLTAVKMMSKLGVENCFGIISQQNECHDRSAFNALRIGMGSSEQNYTLVNGKIQKMLSELTGVSL